jgi:hypothetical protein
MAFALLNMACPDALVALDRSGVRRRKIDKIDTMHCRALPNRASGHAISANRSKYIADDQ